jgi:hypothetical protein
MLMLWLPLVDILRNFEEYNSVFISSFLKPEIEF